MSQLTPHAATLEPSAVQTPHVITRRAVVGWVLYDLANTIFSLGIVSLYFSLYVRNATGAESADRVYGIITAISMGIIFVVSPALGAMTDRARRRMPFLVCSTLICVGFTCLLARVGFYATAVCFIIANIAYQAGLQFYDAMLPEVSTEANRGRIGGIGVAIGYIGSFVGLAIGYVVGNENKSLLFTLIAIAFLLFALPCFLFVRERGNLNPRPITWRSVIDSTRETIRTLRSGKEYPGLLRFLVGRVFYTDAVNTLITVMALYTVNVALATGLSEVASEAETTKVLGLAISFAVAGGFFWGWMVDRIGAKRALDWVLKSWMVIFTFAACVGIFKLGLIALYVVASLAGIALAGVWSADRPLMLSLTPPHRVGEFYGLYGMVGRFSAITGPIIWAGITSLAVQGFGLEPLTGQGLSIVVLSVLVVISYVILRPVEAKVKVEGRRAKVKD
ncbi:MAG: MFS transporter [Pyrinomonadaceae bacterium MAG19_C2-C3]|nr:MFS transporter [Pyrinomonadaceae bacterium MAG19_C2-C3]